jgi:hypothetical protein
VTLGESEPYPVTVFLTNNNLVFILIVVIYTDFMPEVLSFSKPQETQLNMIRTMPRWFVESRATLRA